MTGLRRFEVINFVAICRHGGGYVDKTEISLCRLFMSTEALSMTALPDISWRNAEAFLQLPYLLKYHGSSCLHYEQ